MNKIVVDDAEIVAMIHGVEELLAHAHQRRGAAGREIEPAEQFEPARLGGAIQLGRGIGGRRLPPGGDRGIDAGAIVAEGCRQRLEEGDARSDRQRRIVGENLVGERHAGGLAAAGKQRLAELDQAVRALTRRLPASRRINARLRSAMLCSISLKNEVFTATIPFAHSVRHEIS